jgi:hypothetical protein
VIKRSEGEMGNPVSKQIPATKTTCAAERKELDLLKFIRVIFQDSQFKYNILVKLLYLKAADKMSILSTGLAVKKWVGSFFEIVTSRIWLQSCWLLN